MNQNHFSLQDKVVIVTGAAGNLGMGYATHLKDAGATVCALDINEAKLTTAFESNPNLHLRAVDLTCETDVVEVVSEIVKKYGRIDGLINNAAMNPAVGVDDTTNLFAPYEDYSIELFRKELDANLTSMMITIKAVAPTMMKQGQGSIINVASEVSVAAHDHRVYQTPGKYKSPGYTSSKAGVVGLTRQWAARLGEKNVRVNAISIGGVKFGAMPEDFAERFGNMNMFGRMARPGEYNATMQYLLSDASSFMTGANLVIDAGKTAW